MERACETNRSGNPGALAEARLIPFAGSEDLGEDFGGASDLFESAVERGEAEAHMIGRAEVADDAAFD